jgi:PAS domain S-box-containing protein
MPQSTSTHDHLHALRHAALDALDCQIAVLAASGNVVFVNEAWSRSGRSGELSATSCDLGTNFLDTVRRIPLARSEQVVEGVRAVLARRFNRFSLEYPNQDHPDESEPQQRRFHMSVTACDISGAPHAVIAHRTIAVIQPNEPSELASTERLARLIDAAPHLVWSVSADGRVDYCNSAWTHLVGAGVGAAVEEVLVPHMHPSDCERWRRRWHEARERSESYEIEYRLRASGGETCQWYLERGTPVRAAQSGEIECWIVTATLIDAAKRQEEELRNMLHRRDEFFATLLHELRNPLAPIANALELLGSNLGDALSVNVARGIIQRQLHQLTRLVDDLLDVTRISHGNVELQRRTVDLAEIVAVAVESARPLIQLRQHSLTTAVTDRPIVLDADPVRLGQVLTNLLINAAKYTPAGGHISITTALEGTEAIVRVRDNGIGIASEKLSEVFELFAQAAPRSSASGAGLGVGLAVAKQLVELHGGSICAYSEGGGRGSEFTIRLPVRTPS